MNERTFAALLFLLPCLPLQAQTPPPLNSLPLLDGKAHELARFRCHAGTDSLPDNGPGDCRAIPGESLWLAFSLKNMADVPQRFMLDAGRWGSVTAYFHLPGNGPPVQKSSGGELGLHQRDVAYYRPLLAWEIPAGETHTVYLRLSGESAYFNPSPFALKLVPEALFEREKQQRLASQSLFLGVILVMALYNFLIYLSVRDISFFWYVISIVGAGVYYSFFYGFQLEYLWPDSPRWDVHSFAFVLPATGVARLYFTKRYLNTSVLLPAWDRLLSILTVLYLLPVGLALAAYWGRLDLLPVLVQLIGWLGTAVLTSMLLAGLAGYRKGFRPALFFITANVLFVFGAVLFIFREINWLPDNFFTRYVVQLGIIAQAVLFSLGLAYRLNRARQDLSDEKLSKERLALEKEQEKTELVVQKKAELEREVVRQTAHLRQKTLELEKALARISESENNLRELNEVKNKIFSIISHDLRSPVVTLDAFLNLLSQHAGRLSPAEFEGLSAKTRQALGNLSFLLDNLLNWSRTQMDQVGVRPEALALAGLVEKNLLLFAYPIEQKNLSVDVALGEHQTVYADRAMIDTVLRNLVSNAVKFSPSGGRLGLYTTGGGGFACLTVTDSGSGFGHEQLTAFRAGRRLQPSKGTQGEKGTGLGLLVCQEFVSANGGALAVEDRPGGGAAVSMTLPTPGHGLISDQVLRIKR